MVSRLGFQTQRTYDKSLERADPVLLIFLSYPRPGCPSVVSLSCPFLSLTSTELFVRSSVITLSLAEHTEEKREEKSFHIFNSPVFLEIYYIPDTVPIRWTRQFLSTGAQSPADDRIGRRKLSWWTELNSSPGSAANLGERPLLPGPSWSHLQWRLCTSWAPDFICQEGMWWDHLESDQEGKQYAVWKTRGEEQGCRVLLFLYFSTTGSFPLSSAVLRSHGQSAMERLLSLPTGGRLGDG